MKQSAFQRQLVCGFTVVVDTREQQPYEFRGFRSDYRSKKAELIVPTIRKALNSGDYSIQGLENRVAIERKSKKDLYGTLGAGRDRFVRELERLNKYDFAAIVVESPWMGWCAVCKRIAARRKAIERPDWDQVGCDDCGMLIPPKHSKMRPKVIAHSIWSWQQTFKGVHWNCGDGRDFGEVATLRMLEKFWRQWQGSSATNKDAVRNSDG